MLNKVKIALRLTTTAYDSEVQSLIDAAELDLGVAGVDFVGEPNALIQRAIITYCRMNFGSPSDYDKLKAAYDEMKAQMSTATGYTDWGGV